MPTFPLRFSSTGTVRPRLWQLCLTLVLTGIAVVPTAVRAQVVVGGAQRPSVEVNLGALDALGPSAPDNPAKASTAQRKEGSGKLTLHPPGTAKGQSKSEKKPAAADTAKPKAKKTAVARDTGSTPAAKPVAAISRAPANAVATPKQQTATAPAPAPAAPAKEAAAATVTPTDAAGALPPTPVPTATPGPIPAAPAIAAAPPVTSVAAVAPRDPAPAPPRTKIEPTAAGGRHVLFDAGAADVPEAAKPDLDALAQKLLANEQMHLQLVAYAGGGADEANQARRLSLSRALAVRSYLIDHGVRNSRMDVRALGNRPDGGGPPDRVDIVVVDR